MASLKAMARCIALDDPNSFSVVKDFFGYASPPPWRLAPSQTDLPQFLSLLRQMQLLRQKHFHLDLIRVGAGANGLLHPIDEECVDCAVQLTRDTYATAGIGIGRVNRWWDLLTTFVPSSLFARLSGWMNLDTLSLYLRLSTWMNLDYRQFNVINDADEAGELVDLFTAPSDGVDIFFVQAWDSGAGPSFGGIHRQKPWGDGVVVTCWSADFFRTGCILAHELGHILGLDERNNEPQNVMCQSQYLGPRATWDPDQVNKIKSSGLVKPPC
jgi:hypothetical protein